MLLKLQPGTSGFALVFLILVNLIPVVAMVAFQKGHPKLAGAMIFVPLGVALIIGIYAHYLSAGADNVLRMPPGEWRSSFQLSAILLSVLEALGCWIGFRIFGSIRAKDCSEPEGSNYLITQCPPKEVCLHGQSKAADS